MLLRKLSVYILLSCDQMENPSYMASQEPPGLEHILKNTGVVVLVGKIVYYGMSTCVGCCESD